MIWTNGRLEIVDGNFTKNESPKHGGVLLASEFSTINVAGGHFEGNKAQDGGVIMAVKGSIVYIEGGMFSGNDASSEGGAVSLSHGANIKVQTPSFLDLLRCDLPRIRIFEGRACQRKIRLAIVSRQMTSWSVDVCL